MGTLVYAGNVGLEGVLGSRRGQLMSKVVALTPAHGSMAQVAGVVFFGGLVNCFGDSHTSLCTLGSPQWLPCSGAMGLPLCLCIGFSSVWDTPPAISFSLPTSEDFLASLGNFPLGLRHPPFPLPQPMASLSRLRGSTMS